MKHSYWIAHYLQKSYASEKCKTITLRIIIIMMDKLFFLSHIPLPQAESMAFNSQPDGCQSQWLVWLLCLVQSCAYKSMTGCSTANHCVSLSEWQLSWGDGVTASRLSKKNVWTKISFTNSTKFNGEVKVAMHLGKYVYRTDTVVRPWIRPGPGYKPCVSEHLPYEES